MYRYVRGFFFVSGFTEAKFGLHRTDHPDFGSASYASPRAIPRVYHPPNSTFVAKVLPLLSSDEQKSNLEIFTSFYTRYYNSDTGRASSRWLYERVTNYTDKFASTELKERVQIELVLVGHNFKQESVVRPFLFLLPEFLHILFPQLIRFIPRNASGL